MSDMWIAGDEDGGVSVVCADPKCMQSGPVSEHNPRGLYYSPIAVTPYRPTPAQVIETWDAHIRAAHANHP